MPKRKVPASEPKNGVEEAWSDKERPILGITDPLFEKRLKEELKLPTRRVRGKKGLEPPPTHLTHSFKSTRKTTKYNSPDPAAEDWRLAKITAKLGIIERLKEDADLVTLVESGLPIGTVSALIQHGILEKEIYAIIVPRRTLQHRRARKEKLSREESDRAVRLARLMTLAEDVFGTQDTEDLWGGGDASSRWLRAPKKRFQGRTPMDMLATETGSRLVEEALYQIDEGMAA